MIIAAMNDGFWQLNWAPSVLNVGMNITYDCPKDGDRPAFRASSLYDIEPSANSGRFYRVQTPSGQDCWVTFEVRQGSAGHLTPEDDRWTSESAVMKLEG